MVAVMGGYACGNCGVRLKETDLACPECGMPRAPRGEGPLTEAEVRTESEEIKREGVTNVNGKMNGDMTCGECGAKLQPDDIFCGKCGAKRNAKQHAAPANVAVKKKKADFSEPAYSPYLSSLQKKPRLSGILMPLLLIFALAWVGGMGFLAYRFFLSKSDAGGNVPIVYQNGDPDAGQTVQTPYEEIDALVEPQSESLPEFVWSTDDGRGYSAVVPSNPSGTSPSQPAMKGVVLGDRVRLRAEPNLKSKIINHYDKGVRVEVVRRYTSGREEHPWYNVRVNGRAGWIYGQFVGEVR
jgi:DNA-directed RNA polymerase subunit RPC12/RpoP